MVLTGYYPMLTLKIDESKSVGDFRKEFSATFPFLKIELFRKMANQAEKTGTKDMTILPANQPIGKDAEAIHIGGDTTVTALKSLFLEKLGITIHIYRKSGTMWIETSLTDDWTLERQNDEAEQMNQNLI